MNHLKQQQSYYDLIMNLKVVELESMLDLSKV